MRFLLIITLWMIKYYLCFPHHAVCFDLTHQRRYFYDYSSRNKNEEQIKMAEKNLTKRINRTSIRQDQFTHFHGFNKSIIDLIWLTEIRTLNTFTHSAFTETKIISQLLYLVISVALYNCNREYSAAVKMPKRIMSKEYLQGNPLTCFSILI